MSTWFNTDERRARLRFVAGKWHGTPFFANSEARGVDGGVDCVRLLRAIYAELGVIPADFAVGRFEMDHGQHSERSLLVEVFESAPLAALFCRLPDCAPANILPGDALCFRAGKVPHHAGIMISPSLFVHTIKPVGVHVAALDGHYRGRRIIGSLDAVFRPLP